ncbi:MAG: hypothetical protein WB524_08265 [Acidobacteriaceae bacterium]|jgi:hypothetical protein
MIPTLALVQVQNPHWRGFRCWVPLIMLWLPLLLLSPLILLVLLMACLVGRVNPLRAITTFWGILWSLPGTHVHVRSQENQVLVRIL